MEEHRPRKLLDQVRACLELGEGMPSASNTIPIARSRPASAGAGGTPYRHGVPVESTPTSSAGVAWLSAAPWIQQLPGIDLGTDSHRHIVLNCQRKHVRMWRCDSPIALSVTTPARFTGNRQEVSISENETCLAGNPARQANDRQGVY
jgi:hypothetical protein